MDHNEIALALQRLGVTIAVPLYNREGRCTRFDLHYGKAHYISDLTDRELDIAYKGVKLGIAIAVNNIKRAATELL